MFTSGRSMSTDELSQIVEKPIDEVGLSLEELRSRIKRRQDSALQLTEVSGRWIFEVRPSLSAHLPESFRPDTPQRLLPAAALIAYSIKEETFDKIVYLMNIDNTKFRKPVFPNDLNLLSPGSVKLSLLYIFRLYFDCSLFISLTISSIYISSPLDERTLYALSDALESKLNLIRNLLLSNISISGSLFKKLII